MCRYILIYRIQHYLVITRKTILRNLSLFSKNVKINWSTFCIFCKENLISLREFCPTKRTLFYQENFVSQRKCCLANRFISLREIWSIKRILSTMRSLSYQENFVLLREFCSARRISSYQDLSQKEKRFDMLILKSILVYLLWK